MTETKPTREQMKERIEEVMGCHSVIYSDIIDYVACQHWCDGKKECAEMCLCSLWTKKENTLKRQNDRCISYVYSLIESLPDNTTTE